MAEPLDLRIENKKGFLWITLPDSIKQENISQIQNRIASVINGRTELVALDFSTITKIYSITISLIIYLREYVNKYHGELFIVNVSKQCIMQLKFLHLDKIFNIYQDESEIFQIPE